MIFFLPTTPDLVVYVDSAQIYFRYSGLSDVSDPKLIRILRVFHSDKICTDWPIIEGEKDQKSMATLLKTTGISRYTPNFSDMLFMVIEMASPRGF